MMMEMTLKRKNKDIAEIITKLQTEVDILTPYLVELGKSKLDSSRLLHSYTEGLIEGVKLSLEVINEQ